MTGIGKKAVAKAQIWSEVKLIICIYYFASFGWLFVEALINSSTKVITLYMSFSKKLSVYISETNMNSQKLYSSRLETYEIIIILFQLNIKDEKFYCFEKTILLIDISIKVLFKIFFTSFHDIIVKFNGRKRK